MLTYLSFFLTPAPSPFFKINYCQNKFKGEGEVRHRTNFTPLIITHSQAKRCVLFGDFAQFYAQSIGDTLAIGLISFQAVADMPYFDFLRRITQGASSILKKYFLLSGFHQAEKQTRLGVVIIIVLSEIPMVGGTFQLERRLGKIRLLLPIAITIRFVTRCTSLIAVNTHSAIAMKAVNGEARSVNRDKVMIDSQPVTLSITIGEKPALQHLVRRETDTRHDVGRIESRLLHLGKIVFRDCG